MQERTVDIKTPSGAMPTFIVHPERNGPFPPVFVLMDAPGFREVLRDHARRMATNGYYVMLPDLYYHMGPNVVVNTEAPGGRERMMKLMGGVTDARVKDDVEAMFAHAKGDRAARAEKAGIFGYCMGGRLSIVMAQAFGPRIAAAGAIHAGRLVTKEDASPHRHVDNIKAELYFGVADRDEGFTREHMAEMEQALKAAGIRYEIELHKDALHGYTMRDRDVFNKPATERVWERLIPLFARLLK